MSYSETLADGAHSHEVPWHEHAAYSELGHAHPFVYHDHPAYSELDHVHAPPLALPHEPAPGGYPDGAIVVAAADWPWPSGAHFVCDGVDDQEQFNLANAALPAFGGKIVATGGTFSVADSIRLTKDNPWLTGFGASTVFVPTQSFAADGYVMGQSPHYVIEVYRDDKSPVRRAQLSQFAIRGNGRVYPNPVSGIKFISLRGGLERIWINGLSGDGLYSAPVPGGDKSGWNCMESTYSHLNIGGNLGSGVAGNYADQHFVDCQIYANAVSNLSGHFTGVMMTGCHFYGGAGNPAKTQTRVNCDFLSCSRFSLANCKIEHAARELVRMTRSGHIRFSSVGFRNGCSDTASPSSQMVINSGANGWYGMILDGCRFDKDSAVSNPTWNIEIIGDSLRSARISATDFGGASEGDITPFGPDGKGVVIGKRSTVNQFGRNGGNPNDVGDWLGAGEPGIEVEDWTTHWIWKCVPGGAGEDRTHWIPIYTPASMAV